MKNALLSFVAVAAIAAPLNAAEPVKKLLVVTTTAGFRHSSIPTAERIITRLAAQSGAFTVEFIQQPDGQPIAPKAPAALKAGATPADEAAFKAAEEKFKADQAAYQAANALWQPKLKQALMKLSPGSLRNYDGVAFISTTGDLPIPDRDGFLNWIRSGKAFIGIHGASDTFHGWKEFTEMIGAEFDRHGAQVGVEILNQDPANPATVHLAKVWRVPQEEIYQFKNYDPARVHELLVMDKHPNNKSPGHYPVSWCSEFGKGKVFYTSLGHRDDIWDTDPSIKDRKNPVEVSEAFQSHVLGGIQWALGIEAAGAAKPAP